MLLPVAWEHMSQEWLGLLLYTEIVVFRICCHTLPPHTHAHMFLIVLLMSHSFTILINFAYPLSCLSALQSLESELPRTQHAKLPFSTTIESSSSPRKAKTNMPSTMRCHDEKSDERPCTIRMARDKNMFHYKIAHAPHRARSSNEEIELLFYARKNAYCRSPCAHAPRKQRENNIIG